jgi:hypothetical protein
MAEKIKNPTALPSTRLAMKNPLKVIKTIIRIWLCR